MQLTFNASNNNFSAIARALTDDTGVEVSAGFVATRIKRMVAKEALQRSGVKIAVSDTWKAGSGGSLQKKSFATGLQTPPLKMVEN